MCFGLIAERRTKTMTDHNPLPRCPYCGGEMYEAGNSTCRWYMCQRCLSGSPRKIIDKTEYPTERLAVIAALQEARKAAMNRWQEPNVPLALEELIEYGKNPSNAPAWYEYRGLSEVGCWIDVERIRDIDYDNLDDAYGIHWRCWLRKPTKKEMTTTPWESKRRTKNDD